MTDHNGRANDDADIPDLDPPVLDGWDFVFVLAVLGGVALALVGVVLLYRERGGP